MAKFAAEFLGTLILVLFGCGAAVLNGPEPDKLALAFGFAIVAAAYALGPVSGAHLNPAVSLAVWLARRMSLSQMLLYWAAQILGAVAGAAILTGVAGGTAHLGQNGWGAASGGGFGLPAAALFETAMTAIFVAVVLGATAEVSTVRFAGLAIGLTLAAIHIVGIPVTGVSVNPARSLGPALLAGGEALQQLWLFIVAPLAGAVIGAAPFRLRLLPSAPDTTDLPARPGLA